jgi:hypothetical protein
MKRVLMLVIGFCVIACKNPYRETENDRIGTLIDFSPGVQLEVQDGGLTDAEVQKLILMGVHP